LPFVFILQKTTHFSPHGTAYRLLSAYMRASDTDDLLLIGVSHDRASLAKRLNRSRCRFAMLT